MDHSSYLVIFTITLSFITFCVFWNKLPKHNRKRYFGILLLLLVISFGGGMAYMSHISFYKPEKKPKPLQNTSRAACVESEIYLYQGDFIAIRMAGTQSLFQYTGVSSKVRINSNGGTRVKVLTIDVNDGSNLHKLPYTQRPKDKQLLLAHHSLR